MLTKLTKKIFLFHINDEQLDKRSKPIYEYFNYVWRTCCSPKYFLSNKVKCIPPGYKSGFEQKFDVDNAIDQISDAFYNNNLVDDDSCYTVKWMKNKVLNG